MHPEVLYSHYKFDVVGTDSSIKINQFEAAVLFNYDLLTLRHSGGTSLLPYGEYKGGHKEHAVELN